MTLPAKEPLIFLVVLAAWAFWIFISRLSNAKESLRALVKEKEDALKRQTDELQQERNSRLILEDRIVGEAATFTTLYEAAKRLTHTDSSKIRQGAVQLLTAVLKVEAGSLYELGENPEEGFLRILSSADAAGPPRVTAKDPLIALMRSRGETVSALELLAHETDLAPMPFLAVAPLRGDGGALIGFLAIERIDFLRFSTVTLQLLARLADWVSQSYAQARYAESLMERQIYDPALGVLNSGVLSALLRDARVGSAATMRLLEGISLSEEIAVKVLGSLTTCIEPGSGLLVFRGLMPAELAIWAPALSTAELESRLKEITQRFESLALRTSDGSRLIQISWQVFSLKGPAS